MSIIKSERHEAVQESAGETAKRMTKKGKLSLEELKELETEVMQLA